VLNTLAADDALAQARQGAFLQGLQQSGWTIGRNVQVEARWAAGDPDRLRKYAVELVALAPDVILASGNAAAAPVLQATCAHRFCDRPRSGRCRLRRQPSATGRQRHRVSRVRIWPERQVARAA